MLLLRQTPHCGVLSLLLPVTYFHLVCGQQCLNATIRDCNRNQVLITWNKCTKCICRKGFYQHHGLGSCHRCGNCHYPFVVRKNCSQISNTECGMCKETYYHTKSGCKKCQECEHDVIISCGKNHDTICAAKVTTPTTSIEKSTVNLKQANGNQPDHDTSTGKDWRRKPIWHILFIVESTLVIIVIFMCVICRKCSQNLYTLTDTSSLDTSLSSLMFTKFKCPDITSLTEQERNTLIRELPGGYAEFLGQLLNPNVPYNNWVYLAYECELTLIEIANLRDKTPECTQDLLLRLGTKNITVEMLWQSLKNIKRDDACGKLVKFILDLRQDNESAVVLIH